MSRQEEAIERDFSRIPPGSEEEAAAILAVPDGRINKLNDRFVKYLFGNERNKALLIDFINDALLLEGAERVCDLEHIANEIAQDAADAKLSRLDLSVKTENGNTVNVEIQIVNQHDFEKRAPYYWSLRHPRQLKKSMSYLELKPTIFICLLAFTMLLDEEPYRNGFSIRNDASGRRLCDDLQIVFLELPKFRRAKFARTRTGLDRWLAYFSNVEDDKMRIIAEEDVSIAEAIQVADRFWADEKERERYFSEQLALMDALSFEKSIRIYAEAEGMKEGMRAGMEEGMKRGLEQGLERGLAEGMEKGLAEGMEKGIEKGMEKGMERGIKEGELQMARSLLARGVSPDIVSESSGLSKDEVEALRNQ